tara:strand:+ start:196 stop:1056 length:861 start_codon:yes stop_codon:yes gene_type:complete
MKNIIKYFLIIFFLIITAFSLNAKDNDKELNIFGINFEKNYNDFFTRLYFDYFIKEKSANLASIAWAWDNDSMMCPTWGGVGNWKTLECEYLNLSGVDETPTITTIEERLRNIKILRDYYSKLYTEGRIKPFVINPPKKSALFKGHVIGIDSVTGQIIYFFASGHLTKKEEFESIKDDPSTPGHDKANAYYENCEKGIARTLLDDVAEAYDTYVQIEMKYPKDLYTEVSNYKIVVDCSSTKISYIIKHKNFNSIFDREMKRLFQDEEYVDLNSSSMIKQILSHIFQ